MKKINIHFLVFAILGTSLSLSGQSLRSTINDGVDAYKKKDYTNAETKFRKGIDKEYETFEGHFNLGDALYKQGKYEEAMSAYKNAMALTQDDYQRSKVFHNVGNSLLKSKKYQESVEAYANALKLDPDDLETKYNLSYALNMLKQQQQQQQQQNQDKNNDKDKNKDQQQNQDKQDQNKQDEQNKQQQQDQQQDQQQQDQQQQKPKEEISKEEAQRILQALKQNESDLQKELRKRKAKVTKKEKDW